MIEKILTIDNFGVLDDFKWNRDSKLQTFLDKNIIYGWNYSGKTTLSRIFSSLQKKTLHNDFLNAKFKLQLENGEEFDSDNISNFNKRVFVFNQEYINSKLTWDSKKEFGEPIAFDVGENTIIRKEIEKIEKRIEFSEKREKLTELPIEEFNEFDNFRITEESKSIRLIISNNTIAFNKGHFKTTLDSISENLLESLIIDKDEEIKQLKIICNSTNDYDNFKELEVNFELENLLKNVTTLLLNEPEKDVIVEILEDNKKLYNWVKDGLNFNENSENCSFCGNKIESKKLTELNNYFSNASKGLRDEISIQKEIIKNEITKINFIQIPKSKNDFTEKVRNDLELKLQVFKEVKKEYIYELNHLLKELNRKEDGNIFNKIQFFKTEYDVSKFEKWLNELNQIIKSHNDLIANFETERNNAREKLKKHLIANFLKTEKYFEKKLRSEKASKWQDIYVKYTKRENKEKQKNEDSLKTITKGKDELNKFIQKFLNREDIKIDVTNQDQFILLRKTKPAKNLSEGEKTAIAFSYFLVQLESLGIPEIIR